MGLDRWFVPAELERLARHADVVDVAGGHVLARRGSAPRELLVVERGAVESADDDGNCEVGRAGTLIGAYELIAGTPHRVTVTTRRATTLVAIFGPAFRWAALKSGPSPVPVPAGEIAALWDAVRASPAHHALAVRRRTRWNVRRSRAATR